MELGNGPHFCPMGQGFGALDVGRKRFARIGVGHLQAGGTMHDAVHPTQVHRGQVVRQAAFDNHQVAVSQMPINIDTQRLHQSAKP